MLETVQGNKSLAAQILGLDRKTRYRKLERFGKTNGNANGASSAPD